MAWSGLTVIFVFGNPAKFPTYLFIPTNSMWYQFGEKLIEFSRHQFFKVCGTADLHDDLLLFYVVFYSLLNAVLATYWLR